MDRVTGPLLESVLAVATLLSLLVIAWLLVRCLSGHMPQPLSSVTLLVVVAVALGAVSGVRLAWRPCGQAGCLPVSWRSLLWAIPSLTLLLLGIVLSLTGSSTAALVAAWCLLIGSDAGWWLSRPGLRRVRELASGAGATTIPATDRWSDPDDHDDELEAVEHDDAALLPPGITQQLTRRRDDQDRETVEGLLRQPLQHGERSRSLHVAFCPPLPHRPQVTVFQLSGPPARIKAAEVHPYGVRFDLRLAAACQSTEEILIHFEARENPP